MKVIVHKAAIPSIAPGDWDRLARVLDQFRGRGFMPHDLANRVGLGYRTALALTQVLASKLAIERTLCVYHRCAPHPVSFRSFDEGFQPVPWECPECEEPVLHSDELTYDIRCALADKADLEFV